SRQALQNSNEHTGRGSAPKKPQAQLDEAYALTNHLPTRPPHLALNFLTTFAPNGKEHAKNVDRFWGDPSELLSHSEIIPDGVVFRDRALSDPEPVSPPNGKASSIG